MNKPKHTPGPWSKPFVWDASKPDILTIGAMRRDCPSLGEKSKRSRDHMLDIDISGDREEMRANAERIVACVNACEGIADPSVVPEMLAFIVGIVIEQTAKKEHGDALYVEKGNELIAKAEGKE